MSDPDTIGKWLGELKEITQFRSSIDDVLEEVPALELARIGKPVIAHVFGQGLMLDIHLMALLAKIAGENPVLEDHVGHVPEMREDWYAWAHKNGY